MVITATGVGLGQQPSTSVQNPAQTPAQTPNQPTSAQPSPAAQPNTSTTPATPQATPPGSPPASTVPAAQIGSAVSLDEAIRIASAQVSGLQQARLNESVAAEDVRQAQA